MRTKELSSPVCVACQGEELLSSLPAPGNSDRQAPVIGRRQQAREEVVPAVYLLQGEGLY